MKQLTGFKHKGFAMYGYIERQRNFREKIKEKKY